MSVIFGVIHIFPALFEAHKLCFRLQIKFRNQLLSRSTASHDHEFTTNFLYFRNLESFGSLPSLPHTFDRFDDQKAPQTFAAKALQKNQLTSNTFDWFCSFTQNRNADAKPKKRISKLVRLIKTEMKSSWDKFTHHFLFVFCSIFCRVSI